MRSGMLGNVFYGAKLQIPLNAFYLWNVKNIPDKYSFNIVSIENRITLKLSLRYVSNEFEHIG